MSGNMEKLIHDIWNAVEIDRYELCRKKKLNQKRDGVNMTDAKYPIFPDDEIGRWGHIIYAEIYEALSRTIGCNKQFRDLISALRALLLFMCAHGSGHDCQTERDTLKKCLANCVKDGTKRDSQLLETAMKDGHNTFCWHNPECEGESSESDENDDDEDSDERSRYPKSKFVSFETEERSGDESEESEEIAELERKTKRHRIF